MRRKGVVPLGWFFAIIITFFLIYVVLSYVSTAFP